MRKFFSTHHHTSSLLVFLAMIFLSCGGGGGGDGGGGGVVTQGELTGQYTMTGLTGISSDGLVVTEEDAVPWSGFIDIGPTTMTIQLTLSGDTTQTGGTYTATWSSDTTGLISDGYDTIDFTLSGGQLTLHFGNLDLGDGRTADMWLYYQKVSDSYTSMSVKSESVGPNDINLFESISQLMKSLVK